MNNFSRLLIGLGTGAAIGIALGMLYAPDEGYTTRRKLLKTSKKLMGTVADTMDEGRESMEEIREVLQKQLYKVNRKLEDLKA
jgi:gas vesicle protein